MPQEKEVTSEAVAGDVTENVVQEVAQSEHIAESKKYRKRAQDAENKLAKLTKTLESQENNKLKEKEEFKTLAEKLEAENTSLNSYKEKYDGLVEQRKTVLLEKLPEDKREQFKNKDLDVLEFMVSQMNNKQIPAEPQARGTVKSQPKNLTQLTEEDKKGNWADIIRSYTNK